MVAFSRNAVALAALVSVLLTHGCCAEQRLNYTSKLAKASSSPWLPAKATWYGAPTGAGPDDNGGACGYKHVNQYPFMSMGSCGNEPLFKDGMGCGACYRIRCVNDRSCSGKPETVMITDMNYYPVAKYHFDLSGTAFGAMAKPGLNDKLRHAGIIDIQFRRVRCKHQGLNVNFHVQRGSNPNYLALLVQYANRDGTVVRMDLMQSTRSGSPTGTWEPMTHSWGAIFRRDTSRPLQGPFSLRIRSESGRTLVAKQVIPANWKPDTAYRSNVQFR
ncbi:hypothetical protein ACQ4PT_029713 [Festuca glaucescens]